MMICERCKESMIQINEGTVQGWTCPKCGWNVLTTQISKIYDDMTTYSVYIKKTVETDKEKIKFIAKIARVNYIRAKQILMKGNACLMKGKAYEVKEVINGLSELGIQFEVIPVFNY